jgi:hypothetical protein
MPLAWKLAKWQCSKQVVAVSSDPVFLPVRTATKLPWRRMRTSTRWPTQLSTWWDAT